MPRLARDEPGDRLQPDVRVRADVEAALLGDRRRSHVVGEAPRADGAVGPTGQGAADADRPDLGRRGCRGARPPGRSRRRARVPAPPPRPPVPGGHRGGRMPRRGVGVATILRLPRHERNSGRRWCARDGSWSRPAWWCSPPGAVGATPRAGPPRRRRRPRAAATPASGDFGTLEGRLPEGRRDRVHRPGRDPDRDQGRHLRRPWLRRPPRARPGAVRHRRGLQQVVQRRRWHQRPQDRGERARLRAVQRAGAHDRGLQRRTSSSSAAAPSSTTRASRPA